MPWTILSASSEILAVHAALLHSGQILMFSGDEHDKGQHDQGLIDHTRLFDCAALTVSAAPSPASDLFCSGHAFLPDGRLLVAGGTEAFPGEVPGIHHPHFPGLRDSNVFDPAGTTWSRVADMNFEPGQTATGGGRWYPTLVTLPDGRVLAMSGHPSSTDSRHTNTSAEAFSASPAPSGSWSFVGPNDDLHAVNYYPRLHVLPSGEVLSTTALANGRTQKLNPTTGVWSDVCAPPTDPIYGGWGSTSVLLPLLPVDGYRARVLLCGAPQAQTLDLGMPAPQWQPTSPRTIPNLPYRNNLNAVLLPTGEVFVCGGVYAGPDSTGVQEAELYQPGIDAWSTLEPAGVVRNYHSVALLLPDGRVWTAGSNHDAQQSFPSPGVDNRELRIELYAPWYWTATRPEITSGPATLSYGQAFEVHCPQAQHISRVALLRAGSCTHAFNPDQRYVGVVFNLLGGDRLGCTAPPNANVAPPGWYLLFVVDEHGVPSVGSFVQLRHAKLVKELKPELKEFKELKPELKELKELKPELKELEKLPVELPGKQVAEQVQFPVGDPFQATRTLAGRVDELEERLAQGRAFIREAERPVVGLGRPQLPDADHPHAEGHGDMAEGHGDAAAEPGRE
jgi:Domain of unknown function (DUF1929)